MKSHNEIIKDIKEGNPSGLPKFFYIRMTDDKDGNYIIKTNCPTQEFVKIMNNYKLSKKSVKFGYNYEDFFALIKKKGYSIECIKPKMEVYF